MVDARVLAAVMTKFARTLARPHDLHELLHDFAERVVEVLPVDGAGVSLVDADGDLRFVSATDDTITKIEQLQEQLQEGPCRDAYRTGDAVIAVDLRREHRWGRFSAGALDAGLQGVAGFPMRIDDDCVGALDVHGIKPLHLDDDEMATAMVLCDVASAYVLNARVLAESRDLSRQLQEALSSRIVIEQAKGVVAERLGVDMDEAFAVLRGYARGNGRRLREVAQQLLDGRVDIAPEQRRR